MKLGIIRRFGFGSCGTQNGVSVRSVSRPNRSFFLLSLTELGIFDKILLQRFNRTTKISFWISWGEFWSWFCAECFAWTIKAWRWFSERNSTGAKLLSVKNSYFRSMTQCIYLSFFIFPRRFMLHRIFFCTLTRSGQMYIRSQTWWETIFSDIKVNFNSGTLLISKLRACTIQTIWSMVLQNIYLCMFPEHKHTGGRLSSSGCIS